MSAMLEESVEISNEEKLQIAQHFLMSAPPGQFSEVRTDVTKLLPEDLLTDSLAGGMARASNLKNSKIVTAPSGKMVSIHKAGEVDNTHYVDPTNGTVFLLDHLTLETFEDTTVVSNQDKSNATLQAALQGSIDEYITSCYLSEVSAGGVFVQDAKFTIVVCGEKTNLKNFWSGMWNSVWNLEVDASASTYKVSGDIKIQVHYFEDGNLQLNSNKAISAEEGTYASESDLGEKVVDRIRSHESLIQNSLDEMYINMSEQTLRSMRRVMPITRTKMEWNINSVRMNYQLHK